VELYEVSKETMARRYVDLHIDSTAVVFSKNGVVRYPVKGNQMPALRIRTGSKLPKTPQSLAGRKISPLIEVDANDWIGGQKFGNFSVNTINRKVDML